MQFRGGINELMRQAARIQRRVEQAKAELKEQEVSASTAGDKVKVTVTLGRTVKQIDVDPEFWKNEGAEIVLASVAAAVNTAFAEAEKTMEAELEKVTGGVKIPGIT